MKKTVYNIKHHERGAKMVEFAGYEMPVEYTGVISEHIAVRTAAGLFDVSHMGEIWIKGKAAKDLIQKVSSNDADLLVPGKAQYSCLPNGKGGIVDDIIVHQYEEMKYLLVVNASNVEKDWRWIVSQNDAGAELENASGKISQLALQGPRSNEILSKLTSAGLDALQSFHLVTAPVGSAKEVIIAATGYTGAGGYELYFRNEEALSLWDEILEAGREYGLVPVGLAARDTLRLEMGYSLYGHELDDTTSPIEAGLGWVTSVKAGKDLIDKELIINQKKTGVSRKLTGFTMLEKAIPRNGYGIYDRDKNLIGTVTSGTMSPVLKKGIGMAYVPVSFSKPGSEILIKIRDKMIPAETVKPPFIKQI
jgi:aminomethyltransferase